MTNVQNLLPTNKFVLSCFFIELKTNKYSSVLFYIKNSSYFFRKLEKNYTIN